jgi:RHS repeat-associated protein
MFDRTKPGFRALASTLAFLTTLFLSGQELSAAAAAGRPQRASLAETAALLGVPAEQLADPVGFARGERARAAEARRRALEQARRHAGADVQEARQAKVKAEARRIEAAHPHLAVARALGEARAERLTPAQTRRKLAQAAPALAAALQRGGEGATPAAGAAGGEGAGGEGVGAREDGGRTTPAPRLLGPTRFEPRAPRVSPRRTLLTPELEAFYAEVRGEGVWVEQWNGALSSVDDVLLGQGSPRVLLAAAGGLPSVMAVPSPVPDDLADVPEAAQTPAVRALAQKLGGKPLALYNWVHARVEPELYYGSRKGAAATLAEGRGNDFDQASLLVALLRASGVPARYEYGAVTLSAAQARALTGEASPERAASLLSRAGVPAAPTADGTGVLTERAWVRAFVPYGDYRGSGAGADGGESLWVRLDPGLKRVAWRQGVDLRGLVSFDFAGYLSSVKPETPLDVYEGQLLAAAKAKDLCHTLEDALLRGEVVQEELRLLPAEHPARVEQSLFLAARPPEALRQRVEVSLEGQVHAFDAAELEGRALSLRYPGATPADVEAIRAAGGLTNVTPALVKVAPSLRLDGVEVRRFPAVTPGLAQRLTVRNVIPGTSPTLSEHQPIAGSVYALASHGGTPSPERLTALKEQAAAAEGEEREEALAHLALASYARSLNEASRRVTGLQAHLVVPLAVEGMAGRDLRVSFSGQTPLALARGLYVLDVFYYQALMSRDADASRTAELVRLLGHHGSALEHKTWEQVLSTPSVSSVRTLQEAARQGVPVLRLTDRRSADRASLTGYPADTLAHVDRSLDAGFRVTIPQRPVNYAERYAQQVGYITENPATGEGSYRIGQLLNGGASTGPTPTGNPGCAACSGSNQPDNSVVDMASGNWRETFEDLSLPNLELPIRWARTYASRAAGNTALGYGWTGTYLVHLRPEADGDVTYVTDDWREVRFDRAAGGTFTAPAGWFFTLAALPGGAGWRLRSSDGVAFTFDASGRPTRLENAKGHSQTLAYAEGRLSEVRDHAGAPALSFHYQGGKLAEVRDLRAGRRVAYAHEGDALVAATDPLAHTERYEYDADFNMTGRVDKQGGRFANFYDFQDRWIGSKNPLGHQTSASYDAVKRESVYVDRTGAAWVRQHNAQGNPVAMTDPLGNRTELTWENGLLREQKDARGFTVKTAYDARGNVLSRTDEAGATTTWLYQPDLSLVRSETRPGTSPVTYAWDGPLLRTATQAGNTTSFTYDARGLLETTTRPGGAVETLTYTPAGQVETVRDGEGKVRRVVRDDAGFITARTDPLQQTERFEVDALGRTRAHVDAEGARTEFTVDALGRRTRVVRGGRVLEVQYDALGRVVRRTDPAGTTRWEYDAEGRVVAHTDPRGQRTALTRDAAGRVVDVAFPDGSRLTQLYCADAAAGAKACAVVDPLGHLTTVELDAAGRPARVVDPLGRVTDRTFEDGRLVAQSGPNTERASYGYDTLGRPDAVEVGALRTAFGYDGRGNRTRVTAGGQTSLAAYDLADRLERTTNPLGRTTEVAYDDAGRLQTRTDANGHTTTFVWDAAGRLEEKRFDDGTAHAFGYDPLGGLRLEKSASHERTYVRDEKGRVTRIRDVTLGKEVELGYDAADNRTSLTVDGARTRYAYDAMGRLTRLEEPSGRVTTFGYDAAGRRVLVQRPNGVRTVSVYDAAGQLTGLVHARGALVLASFAYAYNPDGTVASRTLEDGSREAYGYDAQRRLTSVTYGDGRRVVYALSPQGTRLSVTETPAGATQGRTWTYAHNAFNQLTSLTAPGNVVTTYAYDDHGNLLTETTGTQVRRYTYDRDGRMTRAELPGGQEHAYAYDARGLRVEQRTPAGTSRYLLAGTDVVAELDGANALRARYHFHPQAGDELVAFETGGAAYYPLTDALGSVHLVTDGAGLPVRAYAYDAFGARSSSGSGPDVAFGFQGREHDASGLRYHRDRYASPQTGRWTQPDRDGMVDGPNLYNFVVGNPVSGRDPLGRYTEVIVWSPRISWEHKDGLGGHVSTRIDDLSYSWETNGMQKPKPWSEYLEYNQTFRDGRGYVLDLDAAQEWQLKGSLLSSTGELESDAILNVYNLLTRNCGEIAARSLWRSGISGELPWWRPHPQQVGAWLAAHPLVTGTTYYPQTGSGPTLEQFLTVIWTAQWNQLLLATEAVEWAARAVF